MGKTSVFRRAATMPLAAFLSAAAVIALPSVASAQAKFTGVGDLPGGSFSSQVRDAAKVGSAIIAVGGGNDHLSGCTGPCQSFDTAVLWRWDGVNAPAATRLPNLVVNTTGQRSVFASAITPDGAYLASRARSNASTTNTAINNQVQAVRVRTDLVPDPSANLAIATFPPASVGANSFASAISANGNVLYGQHSGTGRAVRFDAAGSTSVVIPTPTGWSQLVPAARGASADGTVMVGSANNFNFYAGRAFRYVHGSGLSPVPTLAVDGWNGAIAVSSDGNLVTVLGNSPAYPNGEAYLYNATTGATTPLGSPNSAWAPLNAAGMTAYGAVVAISFVTLDPGSNRGFPYFRNTHGWFHVTAALGAQGIDIKAQGWTELQLLGMSADGALLFGGGVHNDQYEGWVAEFPAGYLASFNPQPVPVSDTSIVGAWKVTDSESSPSVVVFMADGTYYHIQPTVTATEVDAAPGFERGLYTWDGVTGLFTVTTLNDTNGDAGLSDNSGMLNAKLFVSGDTISRTLGGQTIGTRIPAPASPLTDTIVGAWAAGNAALDQGSLVIVFDEVGGYYLAQDGPGADDGIEYGTYGWDAVSGGLSVTATVDTNADSGPANAPLPQTLVLTADRLGVHYSNSAPVPENLDLVRVIDPATVVPVITSSLVANGNLGAPFSYTIDATYGASAFGAAGLPAGLTLNGATISGSPAVTGSFNVALSAANTLSTGSAALNITIVSTIATSAGTNVTVTPEVPADTPPVSMTFTSVSAAGTTTLVAIDPAAPQSPVPPTGFSLGDPATYYEVSTTALFSGAVTICFNYAGVNFNDGTPRLFHYTNGAWQDITTSVDAPTTTVCGVTSSFSPFALFASPAPFLTRTGFYSPVIMTTAFVNTVKGGATVPLKFNVSVNGIEKTDTEGLQFSVKPVACTAAVEDAVDFVTAGGTSLRYDESSRQFIQNWQTPKGAGLCYIVRMTTTGDGLYLSAFFKTK